MKRNYYQITVPGDVADTLEQLGNLAIDEAHERSRLYCTPCTWVATCIAGKVGDWEVTFRVVRKHN